MVGVVGARVVLEGVNAVQADGPHRAPGQVPQVHDQVGRDVVHLAVDLLGLAHHRAHASALVVGQGGQFGRQFLAHGFVVRGVDNALGLAAFDVDVHARVVSPRGPGHGARPVHGHLLQGHHAVRILV